ncbi:MAG TPA: hypothetical protein DCS93_18825 [Microscillaceae bacterium]|nr:hypothetical protein [Microscillaceae bacterium]
MSKKLHALLVGINQHHPKSKQVNNLSGCINDVKALQNLFESKFAHLQPQIKTLLDVEATQDNIIREFRAHLTASGNEQTTLLFYFSGHGSRQVMPQMFQKYTGGYHKEETLVCYDSRAWIDEKRLSHDLADKELGVLIEEAASTQAQVVVILDCCRAGSGTRSESRGDHSINLYDDWEPKEVGESEVKSCLERKYLDNYFENMYQAKEMITLPKGKHILLAACQRNQTSWVTTLGEGKSQAKRSVFTYQLEKVLEQNPVLTYANLFTLTHTKVRQHFQKKYASSTPPEQNPQFETYHFFNGQSYFLTGEVPPNNRQLVGMKFLSGYGWQVEQGSIHGLSGVTAHSQPEWLVYEAKNTTKPITEALTTAIYLKTNQVDVIGNILESNQHYLAELLSIPDSPLQVGIPQALPALEPTLVSLVQNPWLDYQLQVSDENYQLKKKNKVIASGANDEAKITGILNQIGRWHLLWQNQHTQSDFQAADFLFTFGVRNQDFLRVMYGSDETIVLNGSDYADGSKSWKIPYVLTAQNNSPRDVYFVLLYMNAEDYNIEVFANEYVPRHQQMVTLIDDDHLSTEDADLPTLDHFKLIASTVELPNYLFEQPGIAEDHQPTIKRSEQALPEDWLAKNLTVVVNPS